MPPAWCMGFLPGYQAPSPIYLCTMLRLRTHQAPSGFIEPCLPTKAQRPPSGEAWLHEIKHDGFRVIARKDGSRVRLYSRPGNDLTRRCPLVVEALARLRSRSCIIGSVVKTTVFPPAMRWPRIRGRFSSSDGVLPATQLIIGADHDEVAKDQGQARAR
jgi:ATP dependent DNA ligase domain